MDKSLIELFYDRTIFFEVFVLSVFLEGLDQSIILILESFISGVLKLFHLAFEDFHKLVLVAIVPEVNRLDSTLASFIIISDFTRDLVPSSDSVVKLDALINGRLVDFSFRELTCCSKSSGNML